MCWKSLVPLARLSVVYRRPSISVHLLPCSNRESEGLLILSLEEEDTSAKESSKEDIWSIYGAHVLVEESYASSRDSHDNKT